LCDRVAAADVDREIPLGHPAEDVVCAAAELFGGRGAARMLHQDQLLVDRYAVSKITKVEHPLPLNTVTVHLTNQMPGVEETRDLQWDSKHTTEESLEVEIGDTGKIIIELASLQPSPVYKYEISVLDEVITFASVGLHLGAKEKPDNLTAAHLLLSDLLESSEAFVDGRAVEADAFPEDVNWWAANHAAEILMAQHDLGRGLETGR
jgi:hypothetical protein